MKTVINIKTDRATKEKAKKLAQEFGFPLSTLINSYLKQFVRTREVHLFAMPQMTPELEAIIEEAEQDLAKGENISPRFSSMEAAIRYLHSKNERRVSSAIRKSVSETFAESAKGVRCATAPL